jgi:diguanylate cyclase (GGDEF)-like protein
VKLLTFLEKQNLFIKIFLGVTLIGAIGWLDFLTGNEFAFSAFYVLPIALVTWLTGRRFGLVASLSSAAVWLGADISSGHSYSNPFIPIWNSIIRLTFFVIITLLLAALRKSLEQVRDLARHDYLTGAVSLRFFHELAQMEIERSQRYRHSFALVYIDLDNFKSMNDQYGHAAGDQILRTVVSSIKGNMRRTDVLARVGGDEFALLLPETDQDSAGVVIAKIQCGLLEEMQRNYWPITFSIGVVSCRSAPGTASELLKMADELMYEVKRDHKNAVKYSTYPD